MQSLPNVEGIYVEFVASGESDPTDSPSELAIKVQAVHGAAQLLSCHHNATVLESSLLKPCLLQSTPLDASLLLTDKHHKIAQFRKSNHAFPCLCRMLTVKRKY